MFNGCGSLWCVWLMPQCQNLYTCGFEVFFYFLSICLTQILSGQLSHLSFNKQMHTKTMNVLVSLTFLSDRQCYSLDSTQHLSEDVSISEGLLKRIFYFAQRGDGRCHIICKPMSYLKKSSCVCHANSAGLNSYIQVTFCSDFAGSITQSQLGDWYLMTVFLMGGLRIHRKAHQSEPLGAKPKW